MVRWVRVLLLGLLLAAALGAGWGTANAYGALWTFHRAVASGEPSLARMPLSTQIFDRQGRILNEVFSEARRTYVPLSQVSPLLIQATIATEDASFYQNWGISPRGIARAVWHNLTQPATLQGGSTITQQLIKNTIIPPEERYEPSAERKVQEALLAVLLTRSYAKDRILEWYLNLVFYGNNSYGVEAAAQAYFGKPARDLTLAEAALLAGLPAAPALYDPYTRPDQAKARQETVLALMARHGYLTEGQVQAAAQEALQLQPRRSAMEAPHFVMYVREVLESRYGPDALYRGGLRVTTTLDLDLQRQAEALLRERVESPAYRQRNARNAALVALRPQTGEVLALVGSAGFEREDIGGQVNMALTPRQPGSTFKPITYVAAFLKGWHPATRLLDQPTPFPDGKGGQWTPKSADGAYRGWMSARQALAMSLNTPAVLALQYVGIPEALALAHRVGITTLLRDDYGLALTLGGGEVPLLDMVYSYAVFANGGMQYGTPRPRSQAPPALRELDPVAILRVEGPDGRLLEAFTEPQRRQVIPAPYAYLITDILSDNGARTPVFGANSALVLTGRPAAVKTGTTDDIRDTWTIGYTPDLVAGVWVGNTDYQPMAPHTFGSATAAPIWNAFMAAALQGTPVRPFAVPPGVVRMAVCGSTGMAPGKGGCPDLREEVFVRGKTPPVDPGDLVKDGPSREPQGRGEAPRQGATPASGTPTGTATPQRGTALAGTATPSVTPPPTATPSASPTPGTSSPQAAVGTPQGVITPAITVTPQQGTRGRG